MGRSVLLQLARDSILEVFEAKRTIDKEKLQLQHPLLNEKIPTTINLYLNGKLRGSYSSQNADLTLMDNVIIGAKKATFEDENFKPLTTSEYLECEVELLLDSPDGVMSQRDPSILSTTSYDIRKEMES